MNAFEYQYPTHLLELAESLRHKKILVTGSQGFIGSHVLNLLSAAKVPCKGISSGKYTSNARLSEAAKKNLYLCDLDNFNAVKMQLQDIDNIVHTATFGSYSWEEDSTDIYKQVSQLQNLLELCRNKKIESFIHLGSSSEYGTDCKDASENQSCQPNSFYSLAKIHCHNLVNYYGKNFGLPVLSLRLFSIYGPGEHPKRLLPTICQSLLFKSELTLAHPLIKRDFVHIFDTLEIILLSLINIKSSDYGESYNVCSGTQTSLEELETILAQKFTFTNIVWNKSVGKKWDLENWYGNPQKTLQRFDWRPRISLSEGIKLTLLFYEQAPQLLQPEVFNPLKKISLVAPCYLDLPSIPLLFQRIEKVFKNLNYTFEFIVIDDVSPDGAYEHLMKYAMQDSRWVLAKHTRNFGSQAVFIHGLELATGEAIILMDGDLQDPPELIPSFIKKWEQGFDLCLGQRISRAEGFAFNMKCKLFYRLWNWFAKIYIPLDCGDFGLISKNAALQIIKQRSRIQLWRSQRAFPAFKTALIPYQRPQRPFGHSTNSNRKLILWSLKFIFSTPNYIALVYTLVGLMGLIGESSFYFWGAWLIVGVGLLLMLLNLIYISRFSHPTYTTEELVRSQLLVRFPQDEKNVDH